MPGSDTALTVDRTYSDPGRHQRCKSRVERHDMNTLSLPLNIRRGGSDTNLNFDVPDGVLDFHKVRLTADSLRQKILKVTEQIKIEQTSRDGNVAEYLKLVSSADKQQAGRIKQVFEKKNQKSAHSILQLQKKLEQYHRKLREIEQNGASRGAKDMARDNLKDIQHSLKDAQVKSRTAPHGLESSKSGMPGVSLTPPVFVFNKSREFANLIRNKFGSADNIAHLKNSLEEFRPEASARPYGGSATIVNKPKYGSDDECSSGTSGSGDSNGNQSFGAGGTGPLGGQGKLAMILEELREIKDTQAQLAEDIEALKVRTPGGPTTRPHRPAPARDSQPEAGAGQRRGEGGLPGLRAVSGHPGSPGVLPDAHLQARAPPAGAADAADGHRERQGATGQVHQRGPGLHDRHPGVRVHHRQVRLAHDEEPLPHPRHLLRCDSPRRIL
ncbi:transmembrane and coiled-coil domains protein 3 isoform X4 [Heterocephalus glaber]|uniref:Transmembrane and coiled-coil domains protein 3 isoform X4 n=1 Tax=Heterocephalus glaber TaxID=10181 RepID=A0AAX6P7D4_HETGA|nr:transmembrane and coiled-coil domains protein 3 isoform X4 [Heterocephalus glaber]